MAVDSTGSSRSAYFWSHEEETKLVKLWEQGVRDPGILSQHITRKPEAIKKKLSRLGLVVVPGKVVKTTTGELEIPKELYSVEEALKLLAGAMDALQKPNLDKTEVARLRAIVIAVRTYQELFADYADYRGVEKELVQLNARYEELVQGMSVQDKTKQSKSATDSQIP